MAAETAIVHILFILYLDAEPAHADRREMASGDLLNRMESLLLEYSAMEKDAHDEEADPEARFENQRDAAAYVRLLTEICDGINKTPFETVGRRSCDPCSYDPH